MITHSADIVIVGSGITAALMAASLAEKTTKSILVVEAGKPTTPFTERVKARERWKAYGESPWKQDHLDDQNATGATWGFSPSMNVGGLAMHWGGVSPRYSPEDFRLRSMYGVGTDWPFSYDDLEDMRDRMPGPAVARLFEDCRPAMPLRSSAVCPSGSKTTAGAKTITSPGG